MVRRLMSLDKKVDWEAVAANNARSSALWEVIHLSHDVATMDDLRDRILGMTEATVVEYAALMRGSPS